MEQYLMRAFGARFRISVSAFCHRLHVRGQLYTFFLLGGSPYAHALWRSRQRSTRAAGFPVSGGKVSVRELTQFGEPLAA
jgi:hypothetical protein